MPQRNSVINRRDALRRAALLLGGVVSAPTLAGVLAGCETPRTERGWTPRVMTAGQAELVATIAEHILPETDTPGARGVGVHRFIDTMLAEYYAATDRANFLAGLADVDARARRAGGKHFVDAPKAQQVAILSELDREAYANASPHFFRTMKELTLLGYYTSEPGATRELQFNPTPGRFEGCVPMSRIGRAWSV